MNGEAINAVSDDIAALMIIGAGIYLAIVKDFNQGYALIGLGFSYLAGKGIPRSQKKVRVDGGGL